MKDLIGQELAVGDPVVVNPPKYKGIVVGTIVKLTPKGAQVQFSAPWVHEIDANGNRTNVKTSPHVATDIVKLDGPAATLYLLGKR